MKIYTIRGWAVYGSCSYNGGFVDADMNWIVASYTEEAQAKTHLRLLEHKSKRYNTPKKTRPYKNVYDPFTTNEAFVSGIYFDVVTIYYQIVEENLYHHFDEFQEEQKLV